VGEFARQVHQVLSGGSSIETDRGWTASLQRDWHEEMERFFDVDLDSAPVKQQRIVRDVTECLDRDGIVVVGAGAHQHWANKVPIRTPRSYLQATASGSLGWAIGGAIGAKLAFPHRQVVTLVGDGDFASVVPDLETAVRCRAGVVYVVMNDGGYGSIRGLQRRHYSERPAVTDFGHPDFGRLAELYGAAGVQVTAGPDFRPALEAALARTSVPTVVDVIIDRQQQYYRAAETALFLQPARVE
jgi:acetolactate synthase-1/2/3 large subunit